MIKLRNTLVLLVLVLLLLGCFIGCGNEKNNDNESENTIILEYNYDIYSLVEPGKSEFNKTVYENSIEQAYQSELAKISTTEEFVEIENKYIELWKKEMTSNLSQLTNTLTSEQAEIVLSAQKLWEDNVIKCAEADNAVLDRKDIGTSFDWLWLSNIREQYKERAIHLSYLYYLITQ